MSSAEQVARIVASITQEDEFNRGVIVFGDVLGAGILNALQVQAEATKTGFRRVELTLCERIDLIYTSDANSETAPVEWCNPEIEQPGVVAFCCSPSLSRSYDRNFDSASVLDAIRSFLLREKVETFTRASLGAEGYTSAVKMSASLNLNWRPVVLIPGSLCPPFDEPALLDRCLSFRMGVE